MFFHPKNLQSENDNPWFQPWFNILLHTQSNVFIKLIKNFIFKATPCGQIPVLNYNGVEISQSMAIARFLANEFGLAGKTNLEKARADM